MTRIIKPSLNGGRVAPSYHWSSDLQAYASSCKEVLNWLPTIERACTRRYGSQNFLELDPIFPSSANFTARHIDFQYGETDFDTVVFHTDTRVLPTADPNDLATAISVYNRNGNRVALFDDTDVPYTNGDLDDLDFFQSSDALYIFSANRPTTELVRNSELDWVLTDHDYNGGPWKLGNSDRTNIISAKVLEWNPATTYEQGDVVFTGNTLFPTGTSSNIFYNSSVIRKNRKTTKTYFYYTRVSVVPTGIAPNDKITIEGAIPAGGQDDLNGTWVVARVDATNNWIDLVTGTEQVEGFTSDYSNNDVSSASLFISGQKQTFHVSKQDTNLGNNPTVQPSDFWTADQFLSGELTLTSTMDVWTAEDVGRAYRIDPNQVSRISGTFGTAAQGEFSDPIPVFGQITLTTEGGVWDGELVLQLSIDGGGSWDDIASISSEDGDRNATVSRTITDFGALVRVYMKERNTATTDTGCKYYVTIDDLQFNYFTVTEYISATEVRAATQAPINTIPSNWRWNAGAFGGTEGYPSTAVVLDDTLIVSGVPGSPGTIYFSQLADWTNWVTGGFTGAAFEVVIGKNTRNIVQWIESKESLLVGTDAGEWTITPRNPDLTLGLTNYQIERQGEYGSASLPAITMGDLVVYVESGGYRIRALEGSIYDRGTFRSIDISYQVPDYFRTNTVKQMAYTRSPYPVLWVLMNDSRIFTWTFDSTNNVSAWAEQKLAGVTEVYSLSTAPTGVGDSVLLAVNVGSKFALQNIRISDDRLDSSTVYTNVDANTIYYFNGRQDNPEVYDSAYILDTESVYSNANTTTHPDPSMIRFNVTVADLRIFDVVTGTQLIEGTDYIRVIGKGPLFISFLKDYSFPDVYDGTTLLVLDTDYEIFDNTELFHLTLTGEYALDWVDLTLKNAGTPIPTNDYMVQSNDNTIILPGILLVNLTIEPTAGGDPLVSEYDYKVRQLDQFFTFTGITRPDRVLVGYPQENQIWPLDLMGDFQLGGPGGSMSYDEVDLLVTDSLGLEARDPQLGQGDDEGWYPIMDLTPTDILGQTLPLYTGVQRFDFSSDTQYSGIDIQIRANGPRPSTISSMAVNVERVK